jgi:hypothetical protein
MSDKILVKTMPFSTTAKSDSKHITIKVKVPTWVWWMSRSIQMEGENRMANAFHHSELVFATAKERYAVASGPQNPPPDRGINKADMRDFADPKMTDLQAAAILPDGFKKQQIENLVEAWNKQMRPYSEVGCNCNTFAAWVWSQIGLKPVDLSWRCPK